MSFAHCTTPSGASTPVKSKPRARYKLVYGVGLNDSTALNPTHIDGRNVKSYNLWTAMLKRCYSTKFQKEGSTYIGCSVAEVWHSFAAFEAWYTENYFEGAALDKDLLVPDNRVYGPDTCAFVPQALNNLLLVCSATRGIHPLGVYFHKPSQKYIAHISIGTVSTHLGYFLTPLAAHKAWQLAKADILESFPADNPRIRKALDLRALQLRDDCANGRITTKL